MRYTLQKNDLQMIKWRKRKGSTVLFMKIDDKKQQLLFLKNRIDLHKKKDARLRHEISVVNRKLYVKKLINDGKVFEKAGILEIYDEAATLQLLIENQNKIKRGSDENHDE
jgi:hypothetical protein